MKLRAAIGAAIIALTALCAGEAAAIPAFARRYTAPCSLCHTPAFPRLNAVGRQFQENGYQLQDSGELPFRAAQNTRPDPDERLELLTNLPLSLRARSRLVYTPDARGAGGNAVTLAAHPFESLDLLAGASLYPDVSFFVAATLVPAVALHHGIVAVHNLFSSHGYLNLRVGRLLLLDFSRPEHRFVTGYGNPIAATRVGLSPTVLDSSLPGVAAYGRVLGRRLFYHLALVQEAGLDPGLFAELQLRAHRTVQVGVLGFDGRAQITDRTRGLAVRFSDRTRIVGGQAEFDTGRLDLRGLALYVNHDNASDEHFHADHWAFRLEAEMILGPHAFLIARYDQLTSHHLTDQAFKTATLHLGYLLLTNLRLGLESNAPLSRVAASTLSLRLEVAL